MERAKVVISTLPPLYGITSSRTGRPGAPRATRGLLAHAQRAGRALAAQGARQRPPHEQPRLPPRLRLQARHADEPGARDEAVSDVVARARVREQESSPFYSVCACGEFGFEFVAN